MAKRYEMGNLWELTNNELHEYLDRWLDPDLPDSPARLEIEDAIHEEFTERELYMPIFVKVLQFAIQNIDNADTEETNIIFCLIVSLEKYYPETAKYLLNLLPKKIQAQFSNRRKIETDAFYDLYQNTDMLTQKYEPKRYREAEIYVATDDDEDDNEFLESINYDPVDNPLGDMPKR